MSNLRLLLLSVLALGWSTAANAQIYAGELSGAAESPPNASPGSGTTVVIFDLALQTLRVDANFSGLLGTTTAAHIHCCVAVPNTGNAGVATQTPTFSGFPGNVTAGTYSNTFNMTLSSTFNASFVTANGGTPAGAAAALHAGVVAGRAYFNLHSSVFPGGEIRQFLALRDIFVDGFEGP